eukprot:10877559-Lingulodinium_polyedra.AAC.1
MLGRAGLHALGPCEPHIDRHPPGTVLGKLSPQGALRVSAQGGADPVEDQAIGRETFAHKFVERTIAVANVLEGRTEPPPVPQ